jgi:chromosome segregation ATPase
MPAFPGAGESAHRAVDTLLSVPQPLTAADAFGVLLSKLSKDPANADLVGELQGLQERITARLEAQRRERTAGLQTECEAVYSRCREVLDSLRELREESNRLNGIANAIGERLDQARADLKEAENSAPDPAGYPTRAELQTWRALVAGARNRCNDIGTRYQAAVLEAGRKTEEARKAAAEFGRLEKQHRMLKAQLEGKPYTNELGLLVAPE